jgi:hypothetical protein
MQGQDLEERDRGLTKSKLTVPKFDVAGSGTARKNLCQNIQSPNKHLNLGSPDQNPGPNPINRDVCSWAITYRYFKEN